MKIDNLLQQRRVRVTLLALLAILLVVAAVLGLVASGKFDNNSQPAQPSVALSAVPTPDPSSTTFPLPQPPPPADVVTGSGAEPSVQNNATNRSETFYGVLTLNMDPSWTILRQSDSSTYIGTIDVEKRCHSLDEPCPQLRIFNARTSADAFANAYTDCDTPPLFQGREKVGGVTAQYYEITPCHGVANPSDFHRIWVIPGKIVIVSQGFNGWEVDNLEAALNSATVR